MNQLLHWQHSAADGLEANSRTGILATLLCVLYGLVSTNYLGRRILGLALDHE